MSALEMQNKRILELKQCYSVQNGVSSWSITVLSNPTYYTGGFCVIKHFWQQAAMNNNTL